MSSVYKYRVWCENDQKWVTTWRDSEEGAPQVCPENPAHYITQSKTTVVETSGVAAPTKSDGTPYVANAPAKPGSPLLPMGMAKDFAFPLSGGYGEVDLTMAELRYLNGATGEVWGDFDAGTDYIEFFVCQPDGTPVGQFGEKLYIPKSGRLPLFVSQESTPVPPSWKMRARYYSQRQTGTSHLVGWIWTYRDPS